MSSFVGAFVGCVESLLFVGAFVGDVTSASSLVGPVVGCVASSSSVVGSTVGCITSPSLVGPSVDCVTLTSSSSFVGLSSVGGGVWWGQPFLSEWSGFPRPGPPCALPLPQPLPGW